MSAPQPEEANAGAPADQQDAGAPLPLPEKALDTTEQRPWPLRLLSSKMADYIGRMAPVWVEGQIVEGNRRRGMSFFTLRDTEADVSLRMTAFSQVLDRVTAPLDPGAHVVVHAKPTFYAKRGDLSLQARTIRAVGIGELLARIDQLRRTLAAEGLFDAERKRDLPFLPRRIGLICGREAKAMHDVLVNARERFPEVAFEVRQVAVQGVNAVREVSAALRELDADPGIDVIVITRGGGSVEDLLPFSNETLVREAAKATTPIVSAIGHETDAPLLDLVADHRASTPTAAAKRIVPDMAAERAGVDNARSRLRHAITHRLRSEQHALDAVRSRPVLADPGVIVTARESDLARDLRTIRLRFGTRLDAASADIRSLGAQVRALSPAATLERGYAVLRTAHGIVRDADDVPPGTSVEAVLADSRLTLTRTADDADAAPGSSGTSSAASGTSGTSAPVDTPTTASTDLVD